MTARLWFGRRASQAPTISGVAPEARFPLTYAGFTPSVSGGVPPYTFSLVGGSVPSGTTFNSANGSITGRVSGTGTFNPVIRVTDSLLLSSDLPLTIDSSAVTYSMSNRTIPLNGTTGAAGVYFRPSGWRGFDRSTIPESGNIAPEPIVGNTGIYGPQLGTDYQVYFIRFAGTIAAASSPENTWLDIPPGGLWFGLQSTGNFTAELRRKLDNVTVVFATVTIT